MCFKTEKYLVFTFCSKFRTNYYTNRYMAYKITLNQSLCCCFLYSMVEFLGLLFVFIQCFFSTKWNGRCVKCVWSQWSLNEEFRVYLCKINTRFQWNRFWIAVNDCQHPIFCNVRKANQTSKGCFFSTWLLPLKWSYL